jgi:hypothetical protein
MGRSSREKIEFATNLLKQGKTFREIRQMLKQKFGTSMSFTTLTKLSMIQETEETNLIRMEKLEQELDLFKNLYFDLKKKYDQKPN